MRLQTNVVFNGGLVQEQRVLLLALRMERLQDFGAVVEGLDAHTCEEGIAHLMGAGRHMTRR